MRTRRIGAYGVLGDDAGRVLLTRSSALSDVVGTWYLPGGGVEHGEAPADTVVREVAEETGLRVAVTGVRDVVSDVLAIPARGERLHTDRVLYDLRLLGGELRAEPAGTTDLVRWVAPDELAGLRLMPFVAAALGQQVRAPWVRPDLPPAEPAPEPVPGAPRGQRFAAYAVATDPAGRLLLTRISPGYPGAGRWHLPGGGVDHGEQPGQGLLRELREETDQLGVLGELLDVSSHRDPAALGPEGYPLDWHAVRVLYRVRVPDPTRPRVMDPDNSTDAAEWFTPTRIADHAITDVVRRALDALPSSR